MLLNIRTGFSRPDHQYKKPRIQPGDQRGDEPRKPLQPAAVDKLAHHLAAAGEDHQRHNGKAELQAQNHLAQDQQLLCAALAREWQPR